MVIWKSNALVIQGIGVGVAALMGFVGTFDNIKNNRLCYWSKSKRRRRSSGTGYITACRGCVWGKSMIFIFIEYFFKILIFFIIKI